MKNHGWQTEIEPETTPEHVFQVKGELGNEAPTAIVTVLTNPIAAGTTSNRVRPASRPARTVAHCRAASACAPGSRPPGVMRPRAAPTSPCNRPMKGRARVRPANLLAGDHVLRLSTPAWPRPLGVLMRSDPTQGFHPRRPWVKPE